MAKQYVFEARAAIVTTVVNGRSIELEKGGSPFRTTDPDEAAALRDIDGVREISNGGKD